MQASVLQPPAKLEVRGITKRFWVDGRVVTALDQVSLELREGEFVTLIGPSGCGKSTLLNIVCGLQEPDEGSVLLDGRPAPQRLGRLAYMLQRDLLLPWRTVLGNVMLGPELEGRPLAEARAEALAALPLFGLAGFGDALPATLSGGMRQRAALLRTFLLHREVMLLDEPFGALDALTRIQLQEWLLAVWSQFRKTILFVTHDVEEAIFLGDRVLSDVAQAGRIAMEVAVPLPRPRGRNLASQPAFLELKEQLLAALVDGMGNRAWTAVGAEIVVVKLDAHGGEVFRYPALLVRDDGDEVMLHARWTRAARDLGYVLLEPQDCWTERFYRRRWYNIFEIRTASGRLKGWYCNICRPATLEEGELHCVDLELDLWVDPTGHILRLDEAEFEALGLQAREPDAYREARAAFEGLMARASAGGLALPPGDAVPFLC